MSNTHRNLIKLVSMSDVRT